MSKIDDVLWKVIVISLLIIVFSYHLISCISLGFELGKVVMKSRAYIADWNGRLPYRQFFKEVRGTDSPIKNIYIKNWSLITETEDGNQDMIGLEIKWR